MSPAPERPDPSHVQPSTKAGKAMHDWLGWHPIDGRDSYIVAIEREAAAPVTDAGLREALDAAVDVVLGYGAAPPEYPGLALVPQSDIERLRRIRTALRVSDHRPHDRSGDPVEEFPVCSVCGAIQTEDACGRLR